MVEILPKRVEALSETLVVYEPIELKPEAPIIFIATQDTGAGNAVSAVVAEFDNKTNNYIFTAGPSKDVWATKPTVGFAKNEASVQAPINYRRLFESDEFPRPQVVVTGISSSPRGIERSLTRQAKAHGIPVMWVIDCYGSDPGSKRYILPHHQDVSPDKMCVADQEVKDIILGECPWYPADKIEVTGQPAFDYLAESAALKDQNRVELRNLLQISETEKVVLFAGEANGTGETLAKLIESLNHLNEIGLPVSLIVRFHPRDTVAKAGGYQEMLATFKGRLIDTAGTGKNTSQLLPVADVVSSMHSTVNVTALYLHIPTVYLTYLPEVQQRVIQEFQASEVPASEKRAALQINEEDDVVPQIADLLFNPDSEVKRQMLKSQIANYVSDGKSAQRIVQVIQAMLPQDSGFSSH